MPWRTKVACQGCAILKLSLARKSRESSRVALNSFEQDPNKKQEWEVRKSALCISPHFPIHHNCHVSSTFQKLHYVLSFACHLRPSRFRVGILFQPSENLKSTRFNRRFAAVLIAYFSFG